jgi:sterol 14-demethylase
MQQKKFVKVRFWFMLFCVCRGSYSDISKQVGLSTENFRRYVPIIVDEVKRTLEHDVFRSSSQTSATVEAVKLGAEITICTAAATLQGREVREGLDKSFAALYHDLDGGFTPLNMILPYAPLPNNRRRDAAQAKMRKFYMDIIKRRREDGNAVRFVSPIISFSFTLISCSSNA